MADKNVQMKHFNGSDWDNLYPRTLAEVVMLNDNSIATVLSNIANDMENKVDKEGGKVLSDNNYTTNEKNKLLALPSDVYSKTEVDGLIDGVEGGSGTEIQVSSTTPTNPEISLWFQEI